MNADIQLKKAIASVCREVYTRLCRMYMGDDRDSSDQDDQMWERLAEFVCRENIHPVRWIHFHFANCMNCDRPPLIRDLMNRKNLESYRQMEAPSSDDLSNMWDSESRLAHVKIKQVAQEYDLDYGMACRAVLITDKESFSPLFAYCLAESVGDEESKSSLFMAAVLQFAEAPEAYKSSRWAPFIPEEVIIYSERLFHSKHRGSKDDRYTP